MNSTYQKETTCHVCIKEGIINDYETITKEYIKIGCVELNLHSGLYFYIGSKLDISKYKKLGKRELLLLDFLLKNPGCVIDKELIVTTVWSNRIVTDSSLNVTVHNLRQFIKSVSSNILIKNFSGVGYVLYKNTKS
ncbi:MULTISPECIES: helix-turn-helix domain-containing protein [unclassified Moritella]|uniref:winged helix-turn-helix domain-containing protein n=1 Tax=Moritella sp. F3 TaxID=2718882 RepID=UPI0018E1C8B7|nr:hypothetical protein FMO001_13760 [Moritella sp. F1]GIC81598.1 hypothetical protein FMO003_18790 [Moritella sp. F3]